MKKNFFVLFGLFLATLGFKTVLLPLNVNIGGFAGVGQVANYLFGLPFWLTSAVLNAGLFWWGVTHEGRRKVVRALITTLCFSTLLDIIPTSLFPSCSSILEWVYITIASVCVGCGFGLILRGEATTGGSDYLAKILVKHFPSMSMGIACTLINLSIVGVTAFLFGISDLIRALVATILVNESVNITLYVKSNAPLPATLKCIRTVISSVQHQHYGFLHHASNQAPITNLQPGQILTLKAGKHTFIKLQIISITNN